MIWVEIVSSIRRERKCFAHQKFAHIGMSTKTPRYLWQIPLLITAVVAAVLAIPVLSRLEKMRAVVWLVHEDGPLETIGALSSLAAALLLLAAFRQPRAATQPSDPRSLASRNPWCLLLAAMLLMMFGEEINWGQRLIGFHVSERLLDANIQHEFNLHNNRLVHARLTENRLKLAWLAITVAYLCVLPFVAAAVPPIRRAVERLRLPIASLPLAVAVLVATMMYFLLTARKVNAGDYPAAHDIGETNECLIEIAYLLLAVGVWWPGRATGPFSALAVPLVVIALVALPGVPLVVALVRSAIEPEPMLRAVAEMRTGDARQRSGDAQAAIASYRESLSIVPDQLAVHQRLVGLFLRQNQTEQAAQELELILRLDPHNAEAHARLGAIYLQDGLLPEAAAHLSTAVEIAPRFAAAHYYLGLVRLGQRQPVEAAACFREALRLQPNFPPAQEELAKLAADGR